MDIFSRFWGKFGQRSNLQKHRMFTDPEDFFKLVADSTIDINSIDFLTDEAIMVSYSPATEDCEDTLPNTNVVIGKQMVTVAVYILYLVFSGVHDSTGAAQAVRVHGRTPRETVLH